MTTTRTLPAVLATLVALAACGGGSGPTDPPAPTVSSVTVSPLTPSLNVGQSQQLTATAKASDGSTVSGVSVAWASSATNVATVSSSGLVTAVAAGQAAITATVSGVAGSTIVTVVAAQQACDNAKTVTLSAGGSAIYSLTDCIVLPSGANGDRYRVAVIQGSSDDKDSSTDQVTLSVTGLGVSGAPAATPAAAGLVAPRLLDIPGLSARALAQSVRVAEATERFHMQMREREARLLDEIGTRGFLPSHRPAANQALAPLAAAPAKMTFDTLTSGCTTSAAAKATGILVAENNDLIIYQDSAQRVAKPVTSTQAQSLLDYYSSYAKNMVKAYWGTVPDIDSNGKVYVLVSPVASGNTAAFVWSGDFFDNDPNAAGSCPASNAAEVIYFNNDLIQDMDGASPRYQALSTMAHEMKHVVSLYDRIAASQRAGTSLYHPSWVEEGTAEISGEMSSRIAWAAKGGPSPATKVTLSSLQSTGITPENYGFVVNLSRVVGFLSSQPNGLVVSPVGASAGNSVYGSGWTFERWLGDAYGNPNKVAQGDSAFFRAMTDSLAAPGVSGIVNATGKSYDELLNEFYTAIMLHETLAPEPTRTFFTYNFLETTGIFSDPNPPGDFPWPVTLEGTETPTKSFATKDYTGTIGNGGVRIHDFLSNGTGTGAQIRVTMNPPGRILVVRLR